MKKALISVVEPITNFDGTSGFRVAQVENAEDIFEISENLLWVDCADDVKADFFYFSDGVIKEVPVPPKPVLVKVDQPSTSGTTTL